MKLNPELSDQLNLLRFPLIVGIVFWHSYSFEANLALNESIGLHEPGFAASFIREYISHVLASITVPLFFLISGFLFFYDFSFSRIEYSAKIRSRIRSLVLPFVFWNLFVLSVRALIEAYPTTARYLSGKYALISSYGLFDYANAILGLTTRGPIAFQFWFIRDLIVVIVLVPLIALALKRSPYMFLSLLMAVWLSECWSYIPSAQATFFFCLGAFLGTKRYDYPFIQESGGRYLVLYAGISFADALTIGTWFNPYLHKIGILFGICGAFYLAAQLIKCDRVKRALLNLAPAAFFVFAAHEPLLTVIRKLSYRAFTPTNDIQVIAIYFAAPCATIALCILVYRVLGKLFPKFMRVVTGGRGVVPSSQPRIASVPFPS